MTRRGHFNPVFKETLSENASVLLGYCFNGSWVSEAKSERMSYPGGPLYGLAVNKYERSASRGVLGAWFGARCTLLDKAPCSGQDAGVSCPHAGRLRVDYVSVFTDVVALARIEESRLVGKHTRDDQEWSATVWVVKHSSGSLGGGAG